jgi:hypothetical protein
VTKLKAPLGRQMHFGEIATCNATQDHGTGNGLDQLLTSYYSLKVFGLQLWQTLSDEIRT